MGFKIKAPKIKAPKISIPAPKISSIVKAPKIESFVPKVTIGDPTKLITNPVQGVYNATGRVAGSLVGNVGQVLQTPGSAEIIQGTGAAFGIPPQILGGIGTTAFETQAKNYVERKEDWPEMGYSNAPMPQTQNFGMGSNNNMIWAIAGIALLGGLFFILKRK